MKKNESLLPPDARALKDELFLQWDAIEHHLDCVRSKGFTGKLIRIHGDYHLGQVLFTGNDFYILDFEGEPRKPISMRRLKRSPLTDVAGMLRSIDYAIRFFLKENPQFQNLEPWYLLWRFWVSGHFMQSYIEMIKTSDLLPDDEDHIRYMTEALVIDKALYEIGYEIGTRPDWVYIPMRGILDMLPTLTCVRSKSDE